MNTFTPRDLARQLCKLVRGTYAVEEEGLAVPLPDEVILRLYTADGNPVRAYLRQPSPARWELTDLGVVAGGVAEAGHPLLAAAFDAIVRGTAVRYVPNRN